MLTYQMVRVLQAFAQLRAAHGERDPSTSIGTPGHRRWWLSKRWRVELVSQLTPAQSRHARRQLNAWRAAVEGRTAPWPRRVQRRRTRGWRLPPNTVCVSRPSIYGNPYRVGDPDVPDAARAVALFERHVLPGLNLEPLRGKNLACWCAEGSPCHADSLLRAANRPRKVP